MMKLDLLCGAWLLSVIVFHQAAAQFELPCTQPKPSCECEDILDNCPPSPSINIDTLCSGTAVASDLDSTLENLITFCQSECALSYTNCLVSSVNPNCKEIGSKQLSMCSSSDGQLCWSRFVEGIQQQAVNCSSKLCLGVGSETSCTDECRNELNSTSTYLGCCATSLFSECPLKIRHSTAVATFGYCNVPLEPSCAHNFTLSSSVSVSDATPSSPSASFLSLSSSLSPTMSSEVSYSTSTSRSSTSTIRPSASGFVDSTSTSATTAGCCQNGVVSILLMVLLACLALNQY